MRRRSYVMKKSIFRRLSWFKKKFSKRSKALISLKMRTSLTQLNSHLALLRLWSGLRLLISLPPEIKANLKMLSRPQRRKISHHSKLITTMRSVFLKVNALRLHWINFCLESLLNFLTPLNLQRTQNSLRNKLWKRNWFQKRSEKWFANLQLASNQRLDRSRSLRRSQSSSVRLV